MVVFCVTPQCPLHHIPFRTTRGLRTEREHVVQLMNNALELSNNINIIIPVLWLVADCRVLHHPQSLRTSEQEQQHQNQTTKTPKLFCVTFRLSRVIRSVFNVDLLCLFNVNPGNIVSLLNPAQGYLALMLKNKDTSIPDDRIPTFIQFLHGTNISI